MAVEHVSVVILLAEEETEDTDLGTVWERVKVRDNEVGWRHWVGI